MRTLPRGTALLLFGAALMGCLANNTNPTNSARSKSGGVGSIALEIGGIDGDGKSLQLRDYRGKVVLLDFWGEF